MRCASRSCWPLRLLIATWALVGFYGSLAPTAVRSLIGHNSFVLGGLALFAFAIAGAGSVVLFRNTAARSVMFVGNGALIVGVAITLISINGSSAAGFFVGTAVAGTGFGAGFNGAIRSVVPLAEAAEQAGVLSIVYVISYLAMGLPAVVAGFLVVHGGVEVTVREYGLTVIVLAAWPCSAWCWLVAAAPFSRLRSAPTRRSPKPERRLQSVRCMLRFAHGHR